MYIYIHMFCLLLNDLVVPLVRNVSLPLDICVYIYSSISIYVSILLGQRRFARTPYIGYLCI